MKEFTEIEVRSLRIRLSGGFWRFFYRLRRKIARMQALGYYRVLRHEHRPKLYRIEIR